MWSKKHNTADLPVAYWHLLQILWLLSQQLARIGSFLIVCHGYWCHGTWSFLRSWEKLFNLIANFSQKGCLIVLARCRNLKVGSVFVDQYTLYAGLNQKPKTSKKRRPGQKSHRHSENQDPNTAKVKTIVTSPQKLTTCIQGPLSPRQPLASQGILTFPEWTICQNAPILSALTTQLGPL